MVQSLRELHERLARQLDDDEAPVWFLHLPIPPVPIRRIETEEPFVRFIGFGATAGSVDLMLVVPEPVAITIEESSPRRGTTPRRVRLAHYVGLDGEQPVRAAGVRPGPRLRPLRGPPPLAGGGGLRVAFVGAGRRYQSDGYHFSEPSSAGKRQLMSGDCSRNRSGPPAAVISLAVGITQPASSPIAASRNGTAR